MTGLLVEEIMWNLISIKVYFLLHITQIPCSGTLCGTTCQVISEMFLFVLVLYFGLFSFLRGEALLAVLLYGVDALVF